MAKKTETTNYTPDIWRRIPPEEKLEMMAKAHSKGIGASLVVLLMTGTVAVGLRFPWVFWGAFLAVPFVFQFVAAKAWRDIKPRTILEYLAARSAARRYAYSAQSQDLTPELMFKGSLERSRQEDTIEQQMDFDPEKPRPPRTPVWVALFRDTLVMMSEQQGGAKLEFAHPLFERFKATAEGFEDGTPNDRRIRLDVSARKDSTAATFFLTSDYPASLLACERKIQSFIVDHRNHQERSVQIFKELADENPIGLPF